MIKHSWLYKLSIFLCYPIYPSHHRRTISLFNEKQYLHQTGHRCMNVGFHWLGKNRNSNVLVMKLNDVIKNIPQRRLQRIPDVSKRKKKKLRFQML